MSSGTKITLAVITLFVGVIVVYYGFVMPEGEPEAPRIQDPIARADAGATGSRADSRDPSRPAMQETTERRSAHQEPSTARPEPPARIAGQQPLASDEPVLGMLGEQPVTAPPAASDPLHEPSDPTSPASDPAIDPGDESTADPGKAAEDGETSPASEPTPNRADRPANETNRTLTEATSGRPQPNRPASLTQSQPRIMTDYLVREGDTLYSIADGWFGDSALWELITDANPDLDPRRLQIGQRLKLPPRDTSRNDRVAGAGQRSYTVRSGDTLSAIASSVYQDERLWRRIYRANRTAIGPNPDELTVGMRLTIPPKP
jgi:nucleoid-associated protein YgaU